MDADTLLHQTVVRLRAHEGKYAEIARQNPDIGYSWLTKLAHGRLAPIHGELSEIVSTNPPFAPIVDHRSVLAPRAPKSFHDTGAHCFSCALAREEKLGQALNELNGL